MFCFLTCSWKTLLAYCLLTYILPSLRKRTLKFVYTTSWVYPQGLSVPCTLFFPTALWSAEVAVSQMQERLKWGGKQKQLWVLALWDFILALDELFFLCEISLIQFKHLLGVSYTDFFFLVLKITGRDRSCLFKWEPVLQKHKLTAVKS